MVDFRPLLFLNTLALMLLVTAGYASIRRDMPAPELAETSTEGVVAGVSRPAKTSDDKPAAEAESALKPEPTTGSNLTLMGELGKNARVEYRNGTWIDGIKTGNGIYEGADGVRYEGHFVDGRFHGEGTLTRANGDILTGHWVNGRLNGHGTLTTSDGKLYVGNFRNDQFHGEGTLTFPDGRHYEGGFSNGEFHGKGTEVFADGKKYVGQYIDGKFHGKGRLLHPNGSSIEATFRHGEPHGQVRLITAASEVFTARTSEPGVCYREKSDRATQCPQLEGW